MEQSPYIVNAVALDENGKATAALVFGLFSTVTWILPIIGGPVSIVGLIMGYSGRRSSKKRMATIGMVLCLIFLLAAVANGINGARMTLNQVSF
jgi:uncharacterized membrane protein (Fun14 family)